MPRFGDGDREQETSTQNNADTPGKNFIEAKSTQDLANATNGKLRNGLPRAGPSSIRTDVDLLDRELRPPDRAPAPGRGHPTTFGARQRPRAERASPRDSPCSARDKPATEADSVPEPESAPDPDPESDYDQALARTVESQIIPRLLMAHRTGKATPAPGPRHKASPGLIKPKDVERLTHLVRHATEAQAYDFANELSRNGVPVETIYMDLLAPTAHRLGELWREDVANFADVTLGMGRLQYLLRGLSHAFLTQAQDAVVGRRALIVALPGEQHSFGSHMVAEFFRRSGWITQSAPVDTMHRLENIIGNEWFDVAGISVSSERHIDNISTIIAKLRSFSYNPNLGIMVGGKVFIDAPGLVRRLNADATAIDGPSAPVRATRLVSDLT